MARRKYPKPKGYRDGGAVPTDDVTEAISAPPPADPFGLRGGPAIAKPTEVTLAPEAPVAEDDPVVKALHATLRAEELQRNPPRPATIEDVIDSWSISDRRKAFLKANQELVDPSNGRAFKFYKDAAQGRGIEPDTDDEDQFILEGIRREKAHSQALAMENVRANAAPMLPPEPAPAPPAPVAAPMLPPKKKSIQFVAPPSRNPPTYDGKPASGGNVTLTPEERIIARNSFGPIKNENGDWVDLTVDQKERLYAQNKAKLNRMRASGEYRQTTEQSG